MSDLSSPQYHEAIYLLCLLKHLTNSTCKIGTDRHGTRSSDLANASDVCGKGNSTSLDSPHIHVPHPETGSSTSQLHTAPGSLSEQRGRLLDALAFITAVDSNEQSVTAMTMELVDSSSAVRFRIAMNGDVPQVTMDRLRQVGKLLMQAATNHDGRRCHT